MTVYDLNRDQLAQLKQQYYIDFIDENPSYDILADIDAYVSDQDVYNWWSGADFTPDDFFSSAGEEDKEFSLIDNPIYGSREEIAQVLINIATDIRNGANRGRVSAICWKIE